MESGASRFAGTARRRAGELERGAAAVEFALVVPFLAMLVFGIISFGIVFAQQLALGNGARQAARLGVVDGTSCGQIISAAQDAAQTIAMSGSDVSVAVLRGQTASTATNACAGGTTAKPCAGSSPGDSLFVRLSFNSKLIIPLVVADNNYGLTGNGVFRCEFS